MWGQVGGSSFGAEEIHSGLLNVCLTETLYFVHSKTLQETLRFGPSVTAVIVSLQFYPLQESARVLI